jgi:glyoxylase-like metal-dependent hydrolase (beta-lactamase superfamily II)
MVRLIGKFSVVSGPKLTHAWDASSYLVGGAEPALIDCGSSLGYPQLKRGLEAAGYKPRDIRRVVATHGHWDHLSGMARLREESDAELFLHEAECEQIETGDFDRTASFLYNEPFPPVKVDHPLRDGEQLQLGDYRFKVYHTPGHSPGSVCLWAQIGDQKLLIAGDTLYGGYHPRIRSNIDDWHRSLDRLLELDFDVMSIGHCPPTLFFDAKRNVQEARQQLGVLFNPWFRPFHMTSSQ